jgi:hypothetical protein
VAGSPVLWLALGVGGGAVFATAGLVWARSAGLTRVLAALPPAAVCIAEGICALRGGPVTDGGGLLLGAALPIVSGAAARDRLFGAVASAATITVALTGRLDALMP